MGYMLALLPWCVVTSFASLGAILSYDGFWGRGVVCFALVVTLAVTGFKQIPVAHVGLLMCLGRRLPYVVPEGFVLTIPWLVTYEKIFIGNQNLNFLFVAVRCRLETEFEGVAGMPKVLARSGGSVSVEVALTVIPNYFDPWELIRYVNAGGLMRSTREECSETETTLQDTLRDVVGEAARQEGADRTWVEMSLAKSRLTALLLNALGGCVDEYYLLRPGVDIPESERESYEGEIRSHLEALLDGGTADVHGFGTLIFRLNVVRVVPDGKLLEAAETAAIEEQQKTGEIIENRHVINLVRAVVDGSVDESGRQTISQREAYNIVQANLKKVRGAWVQSNNPLTDAAAAFTQLSVSAPPSQTNQRR